MRFYIYIYLLPILVHDERSGSPGEKIIFPFSQTALVSTYCLACFRGHVNDISVLCIAGKIESFTTILKAEMALSVQSAEIVKFLLKQLKRNVLSVFEI